MTIRPAPIVAMTRMPLTRVLHSDDSSFAVIRLGAWHYCAKRWWT